MGFDCRDRGVGDYRRKGTEFISHHEVEQRLVGDRMGVVIVGEFSMRDVIGPGSGVVFTEDPKVRFDFLVYPFSLSVRLGIIGSGEG